MSDFCLTDFFIYPVKSTCRISLEECEVEPAGLKFDRYFAIANNQDKIITARENQNLLKIKTRIEGDTLFFCAVDQEEVAFSMAENYQESEEELLLFKDQVAAKGIHHSINSWLSNIIGEPAQLVKIDQGNLRKMKAKYNGRENDFIGFKDASAIHLISESSMNDLNKNLDKPINKHHFRSNIVIRGGEPYEEDTWKRIKIGKCEFEVAVKTARCPLITVDPETAEKDKNQEPLKTLAKLRKEKNKVNFGIYLIPRKMGVIKIGDEVEVK